MRRAALRQRDLAPELLGQHLGRHFGDAAALEIAELEGPESDADEAVHGEAEMLADLLHLAVLAFADGDIEPGIVALRLVERGLDGSVMDALQSYAAGELGK